MRVGVIGGAGYTAGELLRLLVNHPAAEIAFVHSDSNAGNALGDVHGGLLGETDLRFTAEYDLGAIDVPQSPLLIEYSIFLKSASKPCFLR